MAAELQLKSIIRSSVVVFCFFYSFLLLMQDVILSSWPITILGSIFLCSLWFTFSLPAAEQSVYEGIFGTIDEKGFPTIPIIGHRGAGLDAPENSLSAFKLAKENGCKLVEFDVALTKDKVAVVFHDDLVDRLTTAVGPIENFTYEELSKLDLGEKFPIKGKYKNERIPLLTEVINLCLELELKMIIDIKSGMDIRVASSIIEVYEKYPELYREAAVTTFYPYLLYMIRSKKPNIGGCLSWRPYFLTYRNYCGFRGYTNPFYME